MGMSEELKPVNCRCGGEAQIGKKYLMGNLPDVYVICGNCSIRTGEYYTEAEAIEAWNLAMGERTAKVKRYSFGETLTYDFDGQCECGKWVDALWDYCPSCGARLEWE